MTNIPTDPRLAELRQHVELNYTTDARVAIAWAVEELAKREQRALWQQEPPHCSTCSCEPLPAQMLKPRAKCDTCDRVAPARMAGQRCYMERDQVLCCGELVAVDVGAPKDG